jgi:hypothetical protein
MLATGVRTLAVWWAGRNVWRENLKRHNVTIYKYNFFAPGKLLKKITPCPHKECGPDLTPMPPSPEVGANFYSRDLVALASFGRGPFVCAARGAAI